MPAPANRIQVYVPVDVLEKLEDHAQARGESIASLANRILRWYFGEFPIEPVPRGLEDAQ